MLLKRPTNKQKYSSNINRQQHYILASKQNTKITINNLFTFIEISQRQRHSPSTAFIRLFTLQTDISNSERIQSVVCEDTLRVKRIIVVEEPY